MMEYWQIFYLFLFNVFAFFLTAFICFLFSEPEPFDYTTIPGYKPSEENKKNGNLSEIKENITFSNFLKTLHSEYGNLASFYWGKIYVVSISSSDLWQQLQRNEKIKSVSPVFPAFYSLKNNYRKETASFILKCQNGTMSKNSDCEIRSWQIALTYVFGVEIDEIKCKKLALLITEMNDIHDKLLLEGSDNTEEEEDNLTDAVYKFKNLCKVKSKSATYDIVTKCFLCLAVKRCVFVCFNETVSTILAFDQIIDYSQRFTTLPTSIQRYVLEIIRRAIPYEILCFKFTQEIDLDGHPVPPGIPVIIPVRHLFNDKRIFENQLKIDTIRPLVQELPYFETLVSAVLETTKNLLH